MIVINKKSSRKYSKKNIYSQIDSEEPPDYTKSQINGHLNGSTYDIEIGWFLKEEFPNVCTSLTETIKAITDFIMTPNSKLSLEDDEDKSRVNFKSTNEQLVGYLVLEGWNITSSELTIKFNYQGKSLKTQIQNNPLKLEQIQSIFYYCSEALEQFDDILSAYTPEEIDLDVSNKILDVVLNKLRFAKDQLLKPNNVSFESNLQNKKIFKPNLPNDVIVELKVKNSAIVITSALIQGSNTSKEKKTQGNKNLRNSLTSSKSFFSRKHNQYFEILEQTSVECKPKKLETLCTLIQDAYSMALSCKEKNIVLQSLIFDK